jgi:hypothetical protein
MAMKSNAAFCLYLILAIFLGTSSVSQAEWIENGIPICTAPANQQLPFVVSDGGGGAIIVWLDYTTGTSDIYAQRVDGDGNTLWTTDGIAVCAATGSQYYVDLISDGAGGAIVAWQDLRIMDNPDIYAQRIDASGNALWTTDGVAVCALAGRQMYPGIVSDGDGGAIVAWHDERGTDSDIYAQRLNADGTFLWTTNGIPLSTATGDQYYVEVTSDGIGGAIVTWVDYRVVNDANVYAQRVDPDGNTLWTADGVALCTATANQKWPQITSDDAGGAVVVWRDYRGDIDGDIYAQRVDPDGNTLWTADGVAVCAEAGVQMIPAITSDGAGGAVIAWYDERIDWQGDIYAQRVDGDGNEVWGSTDLAICTATKTQEAVGIIGVGGGAIITWSDDRWGSTTNFGDDIYAQKVTADGDSLWGADGLPISIMTGNQMNPALVSDGAGGAIIAWEDSRVETNLDIYAHRSQLSETEAVEIPALRLALFQNHPNPFNPSTSITYYLPSRAQVAVEVFDASGVLVTLLVDKNQEGGTHTVVWNGLDDRGNHAASGVYFCRLRAGKDSISRKMVLLY